LPGDLASGENMNMQGTKATQSGTLKVFVTGTVVAAFVSMALLPSTGLLEQPVTVALLVVLAAVVGSRSVRIPYLKMRVTASDIFVF
jgi:membrane protein implicated in regulation of membrane protease activity